MSGLIGSITEVGEAGARSWLMGQSLQHLT